METGSDLLLGCQFGVDPFQFLLELVSQGSPSLAVAATELRRGRDSNRSGRDRSGTVSLDSASDNRANPSTCNKADTDPDGHRVRRSAKCYADSDSDGYPDRLFLTSHSEFSWTTLRRCRPARRRQDNPVFAAMGATCPEAQGQLQLLTVIEYSVRRTP